MSRSTKAPPLPLFDRIARARTEGRTQQALELTRQLVKQSPPHAHDDLLRDVLFERGAQLQQQGHTRDAAAVFANALDLGGTAEFRARLAERLAACGDTGRAVQALGPDVDAGAQVRVLGHVVDRALRQGAAGRAALPAELHAGFDAVMQAFAHSEAGRDEEGRAALQVIGLSSPFLEWKLLVRGLLAYYAHDDARALDNWQRLDPQRVPARLAAPLRAGIDAPFRNAQPAATQTALQQQAARLGEAATTTALAELRKALANPKTLAGAFRIAEQMVPDLRRDRPKLVPRLAHCLFWAVVQHGEPEDVDRYRRTFGTDANMFEVARLEALALEHRDITPDAHQAWQNVARAVAGAPQDWPGESCRRAQAIIWAHIGAAAAVHEQNPRHAMLHRLLSRGKEPPSLKPGPVECLRRSIELAPDRLFAYLALFNLYLDREQPGEAQKVGAELLRRFPDHAATAEAMGDLCLETGDYGKAREYFEKALSANPLERRLRGKLAIARRNRGLDFTVAKRFAEARAEYEAALALSEGSTGPVLCQWAILELKAGAGDRAAELIGRALQPAHQRLAVCYSLVSESVRAKLKPADKKLLAAGLAAALAAEPTPAEILALLDAAAEQRQRGLNAFHGQKTHERKILGFLDRLPLGAFGEQDLVKLCRHLEALDARRPWERCLDRAVARFPTNPDLMLSHIDFYLSARSPERGMWHLRRQLDRLRELIQGLPRETQDRLVPALREREQEMQSFLAVPGGAMDMLGGMFGAMGAFQDEFDDEYDEDEFEDW